MSPSPAKHSGRQATKPSKTAFERVLELVKLVDLIVEVGDARAPLSSRHPNADKLFANKPRMTVLTKLDLARASACKKWLKHLAEAGDKEALALSLKSGKGKEDFISAVLAKTADKQKRLTEKGLLPRPVRICVVGMPNVGKSSLINWLVGKRHMKVGDRPGITKAPQWLRLHRQIELLDTPGVLPSRAFDRDTLVKLALLNLVTESNYDSQEVAAEALARFHSEHIEDISTYFGPEGNSLESLAKKRNFLTQGGKLDTRRAAQAFLTDLREGKLGKVMLDSIP